jgi:hypothetical protein
MTSLAHISRFSLSTARQIIESPQKHSEPHLRDASIWLAIHGDALDLFRAAEVIRALDQGVKPRPFRPRAADNGAPVNDHQRVAQFGAIAQAKIRRLAMSRLEVEKNALKEQIVSDTRIGKFLISLIALAFLAAALGLAITIGGRP